MFTRNEAGTKLLTDRRDVQLATVHEVQLEGMLDQTLEYFEVLCDITLTELRSEYSVPQEAVPINTTRHLYAGESLKNAQLSLCFN